MVVELGTRVELGGIECLQHDASDGFISGLYPAV
jgi:hypothetical protein